VRKLVAAATHTRPLGFLGEDYVNVIGLNLSLTGLK
jgi:K+-transporting ATPase c subunit